jgi:GTP-binding protein
VGKSSLLNRLLGRRSIAHISKTPGKTRACNVYDVEGRFWIVDLPGYGYARTSKSERRGLSRLITSYLSSRRELAGVIWLLDIRREPSRDDLGMADLLVDCGIPVLVAVTKADKVSRSRRRQRAQSILDQIGVAEEQCIVTSATNREGVVDLRDSLEALVAGTLGGTVSEQ